MDGLREMKNFRDLRAWQEAHRLTLAVYARTKPFPREEMFGLRSQIRRAAVSIEANIAEGCGRGTDGELQRFVNIAMGSASELECHLLIARDLGLLTDGLHRELQDSIENVRRMLTGLQRSVASQAAAR